MCSGYYSYAEGHRPTWEGEADFQGRIVHPQFWPDDLDYAGKRVVVIGSGATAVTLVPEMAKTAAHVVMLQRSPTYFFPGRNVDELADTLRQLQIDESWIHEIVRRKRLYDQQMMTVRCQEEPDAVAAELLEVVKTFMGEKFDARHFTPRYRPWQQRLAFVPDGDLFKAAAAGQVSFVTDHIERFTETGIRLQSGEELEADLVDDARFDEDRAPGPHGDGDPVRGSAVDPRRLPFLARLEDEGPPVHAALEGVDRHRAHPSPQGLDDVEQEVVGQRPRRLDALGRERDGRGLRRPDPDRHDPIAAALAQQDDGGRGRQLDADSDEVDANHAFTVDHPRERPARRAPRAVRPPRREPAR